MLLRILHEWLAHIVQSAGLYWERTFFLTFTVGAPLYFDGWQFLLTFSPMIDARLLFQEPCCRVKSLLSSKAFEPFLPGVENVWLNICCVCVRYVCKPDEREERNKLAANDMIGTWNFLSNCKLTAIFFSSFFIPLVFSLT